ncbi:MAG: dockerin type I repeat-containing protein, partial [Clostridia bacterium]|nr:dockerin type I repeat-containing protein [Clostridia bacterium]
ITSFNDTTGNITLQLIPEGTSEPAYEVIVKGNTVDYSFINVEHGTYTLKVSKANHVTREYTVVVGSNSETTCNVDLYLLGDANYDGKADSSDAVAILRNLAGYDVPNFHNDSADFNGDGKADSSDAVAILRKLAGY